MPRRKIDPNAPVITHCVKCGVKLGARQFGPEHNLCRSCSTAKFICAKCGRPSKFRYGENKDLCRDCGMTDESRAKFVESRHSSESKRAATCQEKYGCKSPLQNSEVFNKMTRTIQERYGVDRVSQIEEGKYKRRKTCLEKYGVEHPMQNDLVKEKMVNTHYVNNDGKYFADKIQEN